MWAARLILLAQFVVERDGRVDAFLVDGLSQNTSQLPGLRQTVMTGDTLHLERRRLSRRQLADVIVVDGCDHLQHDASSLLRILVVGGEVHLELLGVWFFHMAVDTARRSRSRAWWTPIVCGRCPSEEPANS